jgi:hypothetical protein
MSSDHKRNTGPMLSSLRCGAKTRSGRPCRSPPLNGFEATPNPAFEGLILVANLLLCMGLFCKLFRIPSRLATRIYVSFDNGAGRA